MNIFLIFILPICCCIAGGIFGYWYGLKDQKQADFKEINDILNVMNKRGLITINKDAVELWRNKT